MDALKTSVDALTIENKILNGRYEEHDKILVRGNGKPSLQEDVRSLLNFVKGIRFWLTALALAFMGQFIAVGIGMIITFIQLIPVLENLTIPK